jgi:hypothetical protein
MTGTDLPKIDIQDIASRLWETADECDRAAPGWVRAASFSGGCS